MTCRAGGIAIFGHEVEGSVVDTPRAAVHPAEVPFPSRRDLPDAELATRCRPRAWEGPVRTLETVIILAIPAAATLVALMLWKRARCLVVPAFPLLALGIQRAFGALHDALPLAADRREMAFRRWRSGVDLWAPAGELGAWARRLLGEARDTQDTFRDQGEVPAFLVVLQGRGLPHGERVCVRVSLGRDGCGGSVITEWRGDESLAPATCSQEGRSLAEPLSSGDAGELLGLLASFPGGFGAVRGALVKDGFPCHLVVARRDPAEEVDLSFNLAGIGVEVQDPPVVLARRLLALSRREGGDGRIVGATDAYGNVALGPL